VFKLSVGNDLGIP